MFGTNNIFYIHTLLASSKPSTQEEYNTLNNKKDASAASTATALAPPSLPRIPPVIPVSSTTVPKPTFGPLVPPKDEEVMELVESMNGFITVGKARLVLKRFESVDNAILWLRAKFCGVIDTLDGVASDDDVSLSSDSSESYADEETCCQTSK